MAAHDRVVFQRTESFGEGDMVGARDVLVAKKQHLVLEKQRPDFGEQDIVAGRIPEVDAEHLGADVARQLLDRDRSKRIGADDAGRGYG